jgi:hypothetical protein
MLRYHFIEEKKKRRKEESIDKGENISPAARLKRLRLKL